MFHIQINGTIVVFSENWTFKAHIDFRGSVSLIAYSDSWLNMTPIWYIWRINIWTLWALPQNQKEMKNSETSCDVPYIWDRIQIIPIICNWLNEREAACYQCMLPSAQCHLISLSHRKVSYHRRVWLVQKLAEKSLLFSNGPLPLFLNWRPRSWGQLKPPGDYTLACNEQKWHETIWSVHSPIHLAECLPYPWLNSCWYALTFEMRKKKHNTY